MVQGNGQGQPAGGGDITVCLCGDVMTGRGIDQVLPHPCDPQLYEPYVHDARRYVALAEAAHGPIPAPVSFSYIWGDALQVLERAAPDLRLVNLETAITGDGEPWPGKGIHYRMHPDNAPCITAAGIDCCALANNHVLDWGYEALASTSAVLQGLGIGCAGAGRDLDEAQAPAVVEVPGKGRVLIFAFGAGTSGIPPQWAAAPGRAGVSRLQGLTPEALERAGDTVRAFKRTGDRVVASIHWGGNWGYEVPTVQRRFARGLIDAAGVDLVHGHSCHHVQGLEVYRGRLIIYGCGDFINDYEGIPGYEAYRPDLSLLYFVSLSADGVLTDLHMAPFQVRRFRANRASRADTQWLREVLERENGAAASPVEVDDEGWLRLRCRSSAR